MDSLSEAFNSPDYARKGYMVCRIARDQEVTGLCLEGGAEQNIFIQGGQIALVSRGGDGTPRWYLPTITPPDYEVGDTGLTFAEVYEKEGLNVFELLLPYTGRPDEEEGGEG